MPTIPICRTGCLLINAALHALPVMSVGGGPAYATAQVVEQIKGDGRVIGTVVTPSKDLLRGAQIRVEGSDIVGITDNDSRFLLQRVPAGKQQLTVSYVGFVTARQSAIVSADTLAKAKIILQPLAITDDGDIVVSGRRPIAESEAAALQLKRASTSLVDIIAADSMVGFRTRPSQLP